MGLAKIAQLTPEAMTQERNAKQKNAMIDLNWWKMEAACTADHPPELKEMVEAVVLINVILGKNFFLMVHVVTVLLIPGKVQMGVNVNLINVETGKDYCLMVHVKDVLLILEHKIRVKTVHQMRVGSDLL